MMVFPVEGTLHEMVEAAHGRRKNGHAVGIIEEIETEIKADLIQLELPAVYGTTNNLNDVWGN